MPILDALPVPAHARPAHQPTNAIPAPPRDTLPTQLVSALPNVVMDSSLELRPATLETNFHQDAKTARFNRDTPAQDSHPSAELPGLLPLPLLLPPPLLPPQLLPLPLPPTHFLISTSQVPQT